MYVDYPPSPTLTAPSLAHGGHQSETSKKFNTLSFADSPNSLQIHDTTSPHLKNLYLRAPELTPKTKARTQEHVQNLAANIPAFPCGGERLVHV